jgi:hypothetical protein
MAQYNLKYITFDQLMNSVEQDLELYSNENMIDRQRLIKIVREVNADLGIKINKDQEAILEVKNKKAELPLDFAYLQALFLCEALETKRKPAIMGDHMVQVPVDSQQYNEAGVIKICPTGSFNNEGGGCFFVGKRMDTQEETEYKVTSPIKLTQRALSTCEGRNCFGHNDYYSYEVDINEGLILTNFEKGKLYISYLADMVDENNNILVLDHPLIRPYYEYAVKKRLLENWFLTNDADVGERLKYTVQMLQQARLEAHNYVNGIGYKEIIDHFNLRRKNFLLKYVQAFSNNIL